jgi:diaminopimelate epimerase
LRTLAFAKVETVGNDFALFEDGPGIDWPAVAIAASDRRRGIGSDGILVVGPCSSGEEDVAMRMFNPDGSEDFCGNGLRCAADYARRRGWLADGGTVLQLGRRAEVKFGEDGSVSALMPGPDWTPSGAPYRPELAEWSGDFAVLEGVAGAPVSTGSAHFVVLKSELPKEAEFQALSPRIESHPFFPERTSVIWAQAESERRLRLRIWERGVGETLGCGTGAMAAALVWARARGLAGAFELESRGGVQRVEFESLEGPVWSISTPRTPYSGFWPLGE